MKRIILILSMIFLIVFVFNTGEGQQASNAPIMNTQLFKPPFGLSYGISKERVSQILSTIPKYVFGYDEYGKYKYQLNSRKLHGFSVKRIECEFVDSKGLLCVAVHLKYASDRNFSNLKKAYKRNYGQPDNVNSNDLFEYLSWGKNDNDLHVSIYYFPVSNEGSSLIVVYDHKYDVQRWMNDNPY